MKKTLLTIGMIASGISANAQFLSYIGDTSLFYVGDGALVYNGGGLKTVGSGQVDNHGNIMIVGVAGDQLATTTDGTAAKTDGGNIILRLNDPTNYLSSTYGQLYISGIPQANLTGVVDKEYKTLDHGTYQQMAMPFSAKVFSSIAKDLTGGEFDGNRYSQNAVLIYNNTRVVADHYNPGYATDPNNGTNYFMIGTKGWNADATFPAKTLFTLKGKPYAEQAAVQLNGAGDGLDYGGGYARNQYNEKYNTYLQDAFDLPNGAWVGTYGKNIYQYGNPFFTNIDLSLIGFAESAAGDGNALTDIQGIRYSSSAVVTSPTAGTLTNNGDKYVTFTSGKAPVGDVNNLVIKPMEAFVIKMRNNNSQVGTDRTLAFNKLRRFNMTARAETTNYDVTAAKGVSRGTTSTVKQLGVIGLDAAGNEIERTYFAVYADGTTGRTSTATAQAASSNKYIGTYEEMPEGGIDPSVSNLYWLYINEANENDFAGKEMPLRLYESKIASLKFEILENAKPIANNTSALSSSKSFYIRQNGELLEAKQGQTVPVKSNEIGLFYGNPQSGFLGTPNVVTSRTRIAKDYSDNYFVVFDPSWKKADISVYDMSGKLLINDKNVATLSNYAIKLDKKVNAVYLVKVKSDSGVEIVQKIIK